MSCGSGHDEFTDVLDPGHHHDGEHEDDHEDGGGYAADEDWDLPARPFRLPGREVAVPFACVPAADGAMELCRVLAAGDVRQALMFPLIGGVAAAVAATVATSRKDDAFVAVADPDEAVRRASLRRCTYWSIGTGTVWAATAAATSPVGFYGIGQWLLAAGGLIFASWAARLRLRAPAGEPAPGPAPATPLPALLALPAPAQLPAELADFREEYTAGEHKPLAGAQVTLERLAGGRGFVLHLRFPRGSQGSASTVLTPGFLAGVAKFYDRPTADVTGEPEPDQPSEASARIQVITARGTEDLDRHRAWDGNTTYDPATGTITLGPFDDGAPARYRMHEWGSGAYSGLFAGVSGSGKTTTEHKLMADAGQAVMCVRCGFAASCAQCQMERFIALWPMDPQMQPLALWRGFADQMGWGPGGTLEILQLMTTAGVNRAKNLAETEWWDRDEFGRPRRNTGKGWFDPAPGLPLVCGVLDEWPLMSEHADPVIRAEALACALVCMTALRKAGLGLIIGMQDLGQAGSAILRDLALAFNAVAHRCTILSSFQAGITADPTLLSRNTPGVGYINAYDQRPGTRFHTVAIPTHRTAGYRGVVIRDLVERIATLPIRYDQALTDALEEYGLAHRQVVTEWKGRQDVAPGDQVQQMAENAETIAAATATPGDVSVAGRSAAELLADAIAAGGVQLGPEAAAGVNDVLAAEDSPLRIRAAGGGGMATADLGTLRAVVTAGPGPVSLHRVMELTGMSAELAESGLQQLAAMNLVITGTDGTYRAA